MRSWYGAPPVLEKLMAFLGEDWDDGLLAHAAAVSPFRDVDDALPRIPRRSAR